MSEAGPRAGCPVCGKPTVQHYRPFCCLRCANVDLGRWFNQGYAIPDLEPPDGGVEDED